MRLVIASNRLPFAVSIKDGRRQFTRSSHMTVRRLLADLSEAGGREERREPAVAGHNHN